MPIDPEVEPLLEAGSLPYSEMPVEEARRLMAESAQALSIPDDCQLAEAVDVTAPLAGRSIPLRIYRPLGIAGASPALVYFHGGGWVLGSILTHDAYCHMLAAESGVTIVSVDYRLAPEHPYPAAADDAVDVTRWIQNGGLPQVNGQRLGVGGDSAGGNLAAVVCQQLRPANGDGVCSLRCQLLIYPIVDCDNETPSYQENGEGYLLTKATMDWFWENYCEDPNQRLEPKASPARSRDLRGMPPTLVLTAEYDPLRDEAEQYARRLGDSGANVELKRYDGMVHGFVRRTRELKAARQAMGQVGMFLKQKLAN